MQRIPNRIYPAKVLLFGEYVVLNGADALAVPLTSFFGTWKYHSKDAHSLQYHLLDFVQYLSKPPSSDINFQIDILHLQKELERGLYFDSNIPQGYGAGSSGALCAAIYDAFSISKTDNLSSLKSIFSWMESFFHGSSSGFDPLVSYLNQAIKLSQNHIHPIDHRLNTQGLFLWDTRIKREASDFVSIFMKKKKQEDFVQVIEEKIAPLTTQAIATFLEGQAVKLFHQFHDISVLQYQFFNEMIPANLLKEWKLGLVGNDFKLKICGAGGGGFILGFSKNMPKTQAVIGVENMIILE